MDRISAETSVIYEPPPSVVGYARVSTEDQGASGAGLEVQRETIRAECSRRGWQLERIEEDVLSGRSMKRPGLQSALQDCRSGSASGIVVSKLDRLSRSLIDFAALLEDARRQGYNVVALDLGVDLSTPSGEFLANVMASAAQWERRIISQRTKEALAVKRDQGVVLGRRPYPLDPLARRVHAMRAHGMTLQAIADTLNMEDVPTLGRAPRWTTSNVDMLLRRRALRGAA